MSLSGAGVSQECIDTFNDMKKKHNLSYLIFKIEGDSKVNIEHKGEKGASYEEFTSKFPEKEPRYGVFDFEFNLDDGRPQSKLVFFYWGPDSAAIRPKMIYSSGKEAIKNKLTGLSKEVQANDRSELDKETIVSELKKGK
eukprot:GDKI01047047.1.p1 GENE.GDKI01047047.1~~GDKI01047047.1.p1  ORF type:complete len:140 (+),score=57.12 GDKI01047047.1:88-507(+)